MKVKKYLLFILWLIPFVLNAKSSYTLVWSDEFNTDGKPDTLNWNYEQGFVRNNELQWYQSENAFCEDGRLKIFANHVNLSNPLYLADLKDWRHARKTIGYTSSSITTRGKHQFIYGRFEVRARIPIDQGAWPAIWLLGINKEWPSNGEVDMMEFYRKKGVPSILANACWGANQRYSPKWDSKFKPLDYFLQKDKEWESKFHVWRMDWTPDYICLYLDDELMNKIDLSKTVNPDGFNPFHQPQYLLLNLAIGGNGGDPAISKFPLIYEVDYVRVYQMKNKKLNYR